MAKYDVISYLMDLDLVTEAIYGGSKAIFHYPPLIRVKSHVFFKARLPNPVEISNQQHSSPKKSRVAALVGLK